MILDFYQSKSHESNWNWLDVWTSKQPAVRLLLKHFAQELLRDTLPTCFSRNPAKLLTSVATSG